MNLVEVAGFLGADAEERFTNTGKKVISLRLATKARSGGKDDTIWWRVSIWGDRFDRMLPYLKKGTALIIVGEMSKPEVYTGKDGQQAVSLNLNAEIIKFSPFGKPGERSQEEQPVKMQEELITYGAGQEAGDDLPF
ncbi:MAG: single-stranded DNA-binding protein [Chlamydiales bacterium]|nr:single-stranded DNA-binding protein [Chlamydiales bacterium]